MIFRCREKTEVSSEAIPDEYLVEQLNIGGALIGNWSEPAYLKSPEFAVRNLNGSRDEFALFSAALTAEEIGVIYNHGKPSVRFASAGSLVISSDFGDKSITAGSTASRYAA